MFHLRPDWLFGKSSFGNRTHRTPARKSLTRRLGVERLEDRTLLSVLGGAESFAVLGASTVTNTGRTTITGDVGLYAGPSIVGFAIPPANTVVQGPRSTGLIAGPGLVTGKIRIDDPVAQQAQVDNTKAYNGLAAMPVTSNLTGLNLGGLTLTSGVYHFDTSAQLTGTLKLNAEGSNNAFWVFQIGSTLTTASSSVVQVINFGSKGGSDDGVFWQVGSSATLGTSTSFEGNILALESITLNTTATILNGRALAQTGAVTMDTNTISNVCPLGGPGNGGPGYSGGLMFDTNGNVVPAAANSSIISGMKFNDLNGDGTRQPGDPGLSGFTIFLDANNDGVLNAGETSTVTDANGNYSFANLGPGTYRVREVQQTGFTQTTANPAAIILNSSQIVSGVNFGNFGNFRLISISGNKFQDTNGNGVRDDGEPGLQNFTIYMDVNNNGVLDSGERNTLTDEDGNFSFANVGSGMYRVREVANSGFVQMTNNPANIVVTSGANVTGVVFGNMPVANLATVSKLLFTGRNLINLRNGTFSNQANFVANLYQTSLGRAPDLAGLTYYLRLLQAGYTQTQVTAMFRTNFRL